MEKRASSVNRENAPLLVAGNQPNLVDTLHDSTSPSPHPSNQPHHHHHHQHYGPTPYRWVVLLIILWLQISNAMLWISLAPIASQAKQYYNTSETVIDLFSISFMVMSILLGIPSSWCLDTLGLRRSLVGASLLNMVAAIVRYFSDYMPSTEGRLAVALLGQIMAACAQPMILDCPTLMAATWFGVNERALANTLASVANPLGVALGSLISPVLVPENHTEEHMRTMYGAFAFPAIAGYGITQLFLRNKPAIPPSSSASHELEPFRVGLGHLMKNRNYWLIIGSFGFGIGIYSAFQTLIAQIINPEGYSNDDAGVLSIINVASGIVGAGIAGVIVDKTKRFKEILKICFLFTVGGMVMLLLCNKPDNFALLCTASAIIGFFAFAAMPTALELAVETTYPVAEGTSAGILWMSGQFFGILVTFTMDALAGKNKYPHPTKQGPGKGYPDMRVSVWAMTGAALFALVCSLGINTRYHRLEAEAKDAAEEASYESSDDGDDAAAQALVHTDSSVA